MRKAIGIIGLFVVICIITTIDNGAFLGSGNIENNIRRTALFGFISIGAAVVIISGGIDLSIGAVIALTACLFQIFLTPAYVPLDVQHKVTAVGKAEPGVEGYAVTLQGALGQLKQDDQLTYDYSVQGVEMKGQLNVRSVSVKPGAESLTVVQVRGARPPNGFSPGMTVGVREIRHMSVVLAFALVLLVSLVIGVGHGLLVTKMRLQPFVVTLCGMMIYRGMARYIADDQSLGFVFRLEDVKYLVGGKPFALPVPLIGWISGENEAGLGVEWISLPMVAIMLGVTAVVAMVFLNRTIYGRYLMALGRSEQAARFSGINTDRMVVLAYVICSLLAGFTGILFILEFNTVQPSGSANFYELYAIAAAVLGGCSLRGGEGSIIGVIFGAAVMRVLYNSIQMMDIRPQLEFVIIGLALLAGVLSDELVKRFTARRRARHEALLAERETAGPKKE